MTTSVKPSRTVYSGRKLVTDEIILDHARVGVYHVIYTLGLPDSSSRRVLIGDTSDGVRIWREDNSMISAVHDGKELEGRFVIAGHDGKSVSVEVTEAPIGMLEVKWNPSGSSERR